MSERPPAIVFTREMTLAMEVAHRKAVQTGQEFFRFEDRDFLTSYTGHLLNYLRPKFGIPTPATTPQKDI